MKHTRACAEGRAANNAREGGVLPSSLTAPAGPRRRRPARAPLRYFSRQAVLGRSVGGGEGGGAFGWSNALPRPPLPVTSRSRRRLADAGYAEALCGLEIHSSIALAALSAICRHALYPPRLSER